MYPFVVVHKKKKMMRINLTVGSKEMSVEVDKFVVKPEGTDLMFEFTEDESLEIYKPGDLYKTVHAFNEIEKFNFKPDMRDVG